MFVRVLSTAFLVSALAAGTAAAQAQQGGGKSTTTTTTSGPVVTSDEIVLEGDTTPRPALPTINGDTGLWFVPTGEVMPSGKWSASVFRANYDRRQGLTDVNQIGFTGAIGIADRFELFGSWRLVRIDRDVRPLFVGSDPGFGGVSHRLELVAARGGVRWVNDSQATIPVAAIAALRDRAGSWTLTRNGFFAIAPGFRRTYARGRRDLSRALHRPTEKRRHCFR